MATSVTFAARETSSTAQANELVLGGSTDPATNITFYSDNPDTPADENGDLILEHNGGAPDPDTWVEYNGTVYTFTYTVVGSFPFGDTKVPPELWGKDIAKIVLSDGTILFFVVDGTGTIALLNAIDNGRVSLTGVNTNPPDTGVCFCAGVGILTPSGYRNVETLRAGDMVLNERGEAKQLVWTGRSTVSREDQLVHSNLRPIRIPAGCIGPELPVRDLLVSPQHRVVLEGPEVELLFGVERVLVPARHLADSLAEVAAPAGEVAYYHLLCEDHEILVSNGLPSESFQPARRTIEVMSDDNREMIEGVIAALGEQRMLTRKDALPSLKRGEALALAEAVSRRRAAVRPDAPAQAPVRAAS